MPPSLTERLLVHRSRSVGLVGGWSCYVAICRTVSLNETAGIRYRGRGVRGPLLPARQSAE
eukprot:2516397-Prymnesium_polylepis.1